MNKEEILNLPEGKEIDALVAEKVMGWQFIDVPRGFRPFWNISGRADVTKDIDWSPSTDISAAWEVVEKMSVKGTQFYICTNFSEIDDKKFYVTIGEDILEAFSCHEAYADTAPLAICRAALLTVEE